MGGLINSFWGASGGVLTTPYINLEAGNPSSYSGSGTTWTDLQGNVNATLPSSNIAWNAGGYFYYTAYADPHVISLNSVQTDSLFTIDMWVRMGGNTGDFGYLWSGNGRAGMGVDQGGLGNYGQVYYFNGAVRNLSVISSTTLWVNLTFTTTTSSTFDLYDNGTYGASEGSTINLNKEHIGAYENTSAFTYWFKGDIAIFNYYQRELTPTEILGNYNYYKGQFGH